MFPVQVLVVLSMMIIINEAATLKYKNQTSATTSYGVDKDTYKTLNNKTDYNLNYVSETTPSYELSTPDLFPFVVKPNETALPVLKSFPRIISIPEIFSITSAGTFGDKHLRRG